MAKKPKIVALIPARGGSKGIPRKNIKPLNGVPLIAYNILASLNSKYVNQTYVSTDDDEIAEISRKFGSNVVKRPKELALDNSSSESVLLHFAENVDFDILVFLQCTSPLTTSDDIDNAIKLFFSGKFDSVLSVCEDKGGFLCGGFLWDKNGNSINYNYEKRPRRQELSKTFRENGAIYLITKKGLLEHKNRLFGKVGIYEMPKQRSFEIDEPEDFYFIEKIMPYINKKPLNFFKNKIERLKLVIFDIDGIFTDGSVYLNKKGQETLKFSRIDGKGIELLRKNKLRTAAISSENSEIARKRMEKLKINSVYIGISNKINVYNELKTKYKLKDDQICYCGDDIQDLEPIKSSGFSCCPINSQRIIKENSNYISDIKGGEGFVRDVCNIILTNKGETNERNQN
jgi:N-acylneuraminate cytidylyltransferase